jgi:hypothetical protein
MFGPPPAGHRSAVCANMPAQRARLCVATLAADAYFPPLTEYFHYAVLHLCANRAQHDRAWAPIFDVSRYRAFVHARATLATNSDDSSSFPCTISIQFVFWTAYLTFAAVSFPAPSAVFIRESLNFSKIFNNVI